MLINRPINYDIEDGIIAHLEEHGNRPTGQALNKIVINVFDCCRKKQWWISAVRCDDVVHSLLNRDRRCLELFVDDVVSQHQKAKASIGFTGYPEN